MITIDSFRQRYGRTIDSFVAESQCAATYFEELGECVSVSLTWITPFHLDARIALLLEEDGFSVDLFLNMQDERLGRKCSWNTPPARLRARLTAAFAHLNGYRQPPYGFLDTSTRKPRTSNHIAA